MLTQSGQEEKHLRKKLEKYNSLTQELTSVHEKLIEQFKISVEYDKKLKSDDANIKEANANNLKLSQTLETSKADLNKKSSELEDMKKEIKNMK